MFHNRVNFFLCQLVVMRSSCFLENRNCFHTIFCSDITYIKMCLRMSGGSRRRTTMTVKPNVSEEFRKPAINLIAPGDRVKCTPNAHRVEKFLKKRNIVDKTKLEPTDGVYEKNGVNAKLPRLTPSYDKKISLRRKLVQGETESTRAVGGQDGSAIQETVCAVRTEQVYSGSIEGQESKVEGSTAAKIMTKMGWTPGKGLGKSKSGILNPLMPRKKEDMCGIGLTSDRASWDLCSILAEGDAAFAR